MKGKKCIAMLLAGGQGSRLYALTTRLAKPAVSFGAKYRIIDFTLSNCINSHIDTVGVLTQYQPLLLNEYIGNGEPWDLDRNYGGVTTLPPYMAKKGGEWYKGTANAIYQNLRFMQKYNPENILILSGDHIYKMDYAKMLDFHIKSDADCTIAVINVPQKEASRFGIMSFDENRRITDFEEKPKNPKSTHASMGIYIFKADVLFKELIEDENDPKSSNDFGKNIIPNMLNSGKRMMAYAFEGYWKDVGTIQSLWEANMDLIGDHPEFSLDGEFKIYSRNTALAPCFIGEQGKIENSIITAGCEIYGTVINSVISEGVTVQEGAVVKNSVVMRASTIEKNACVDFGIIDENVTIGQGAQIGGGDKNSIALVGRDVKISAHSKVGKGERVEKEEA